MWSVGTIQGEGTIEWYCTQVNGVNTLFLYFVYLLLSTLATGPRIGSYAAGPWGPKVPPATLGPGAWGLLTLLPWHWGHRVPSKVGIVVCMPMPVGEVI